MRSMERVAIAAVTRGEAPGQAYYNDDGARYAPPPPPPPRDGCIAGHAKHLMAAYLAILIDAAMPSELDVHATSYAWFTGKYDESGAALYEQPDGTSDDGDDDSDPDAADQDPDYAPSRNLGDASVDNQVLPLSPSPTQSTSRAAPRFSPLFT